MQERTIFSIIYLFHSVFWWCTGLGWSQCTIENAKKFKCISFP